jgi:serine/threonine-protein kinase
MNPNRAKLIEKLYLDASKLSKSKRDAFLKKACRKDEALRKEIDSLLVHEKAARGFLDSSAMHALASSLADSWVETPAMQIGDFVGRFRILEKIGSGGMGMVYRARDTNLERMVAVKVLPPGMMSDKSLRQRFVREAKAASALNHPNIITIYDIGSSDGIEFIAMEYVQGHTLRDILSAKRLPLSKALDYSIQIAQALQAAHSAGIIHRDIKPENIMIADERAHPSRVKLLDFGLAKLSALYQQGERVDLDSIKGAIFGTAAYMSPEQAEGKYVDARSDIFSFGAVLYELLSGCKAFQGTSNLAMLHAVVNEEPKSVKGIPKALEDIISSCLNKNPALRFQNARDLEMALVVCRDLRGTSSHHVTPNSFSLKRDVKKSDKTMLAVLPFNNLSYDKEQDYFSDGLTEEMIAELGRLNPEDLGVIARTTVMHLRDSGKNIDEIGNELGVQHILEGSVRRAADRVRITVQLIEVQNQTSLWTATYDRQLEDILDIQQDVAKRTAQSLAMELLPSDHGEKSPAGSRVAGAHEFYLRGLYYWNFRTEESFRTAIEFFNRAIELDPEYALAHSGIARVYNTVGLYGGVPPNLARDRAKSHAQKALAIDSAMPEAYAALGYAQLLFDWNWENSEAAFKTAIGHNPNYTGAHHWYALMLTLVSKFEDAFQRIDKALNLDPLSFILNSQKGWILYFARRFQDALAQLHNAIRLNDNFALSHYFLGLTYLQMAKLEDAIHAFKEARELSGNHPAPCAGLGYAQALLGRKAEALRHLEIINTLAKQRYVSPFFYSWIHIGLGDPDNALALLEEAYNQRCCWMAHLNVEPIMDSLRSDPRFRNLLRRIGTSQSV